MVRYLIIVVGAIVLAGCSSTKYEMTVDALAAPDAPIAADYLLRPANEIIENDELQYREFAEYIHRAMAAAGYSEAAGADRAAMVVLLEYGVSEPRERIRAETEPQVGIGFGYGRGYRSGFGSGAYGSYPAYGPAGYRTRVESYPAYTRVMLLRAYSNQGQAEGRRELWRVLVRSTGTSPDLRKLFPYMVVASQPYIGRSTGREAVTVELKEDDERVARLDRKSVV